MRNVSFKVAEGETLALVGESGSGKSVTSMSVMRLLPEKFARYGKDSRITFDGISILDADEKTLRDLRGNRISVIFQEPMTSLNPFMRIGAQLIEAARVHNKKLGKKEAGQKALALLERVGIKEAERRMKQYPHEFSGGQLQRIMIAMALINEPDLLIADEPTTALACDHSSRRFSICSMICNSKWAWRLFSLPTIWVWRNTIPKPSASCVTAKLSSAAKSKKYLPIRNTNIPPNSSMPFQKA